MAARPDTAAGVAHAAHRLIEACAGVGVIAFDPDPPIDALDAGVRAIAAIYERASPAPHRTRSRRKY